MGAISRFTGSNTYTIGDSQSYVSDGAYITHPSYIVNNTVNGSLHLDLVVIDDDVSITAPSEMTEIYYDTVSTPSSAAMGLYQNQISSGESSNGSDYIMGASSVCFIFSFIINPI